VFDGRVDIALEIYIDDVDAFAAAGDAPIKVIADGKALTPEVLLREPRERKDRVSPFAGMIDPRTLRKMPEPPADKRVIYLELRYPFEGRPDVIVFEPPLSESGIAAATIGFLAYHKSAPVIDFRYLSAPVKLNLDWDDPWFTAFENKMLTRHHRWPQMSFLYIEPREVRHEMLVRVRDLMEWTDNKPENWGVLSDVDKSSLELAAEDFFAGVNPLSIDGVVTSASAFRAEYLSISPTGLQVIDEGQQVDASAAILGVSLSYWIDSLPQNVVVDWELFDERADKVPTNIIDPAGPFPGFATPDYPQIEWQNFLRIYTEPELTPVAFGNNDLIDWSVLRMMLVGAPDEETARAVVQDLLSGVTTAFLERDPARLAEALQVVVASERLEETGSELGKAFAIPTTGGGIASVETMGNLELQELRELDGNEGFSVIASWNAIASGQHWGHVDQRSLRLRAYMDIVRDGDNWKLLDLTLVEIERVEP
jgi:hypothetical protein